MKLYRVYEGEVVSVEVLRDTPMWYWIKGCAAFGYCQNFEKESVCTTPQEAVQEELNKAREMLGACKDRMQCAKDRFVKAHRLESEYPPEYSEEAKYVEAILSCGGEGK